MSLSPVKSFTNYDKTKYFTKYKVFLQSIVTRIAKSEVRTVERCRKNNIVPILTTEVFDKQFRIKSSDIKD